MFFKTFILSLFYNQQIRSWSIKSFKFVHMGSENWPNYIFRILQSHPLPECSASGFIPALSLSKSWPKPTGRNGQNTLHRSKCRYWLGILIHLTKYQNLVAILLPLPLLIPGLLKYPFALLIDSPVIQIYYRLC